MDGHLLDKLYKKFAIKKTNFHTPNKNTYSILLSGLNLQNLTITIKEQL